MVDMRHSDICETDTVYVSNKILLDQKGIIYLRVENVMKDFSRV